MQLLRGAILGQYEAAEPSQIATAECVIGHSFGTSVGPGSVNARLGSLAAFWAEATDTPLIVDHVLAKALPEGAPEPVAVTKGKISTTTGGGLETWGTYLRAEEYMAHHYLWNPIVVAQAFLAVRAARQATKLGMKPILPSGLPHQFDPHAEKQDWTHSRSAWIRRELVGVFVLKAQGRL